MLSPFQVQFDNALLSGVTGGFGLPVVFLHAGVADRRMWQPQLDLLVAEGYHVIAYDRRGYGETSTPDEPFSHLADLEAVLDQLGIQAAVFVGCSMGGFLAIDFAVEHPNRVVGLVLVGTAVNGAPERDLPDEVMALEDAYAHAAERGAIDQMNRIQAHMWLDGPFVESGRVSGAVRDLFLDMNGNHLRQPRLTKQEYPDSAWEALDAITAPVLLVVGDLDMPDVIETHEDLSEMLKNAFAVILEGAAHLPSLERPDLFNPLLIEFLEALTGEADDE